MALVRTMTPEDSERVTALALQLGYNVDHRSVREAVPAALSSQSTALIAEVEGDVVGWVHGYETVLIQYPYPFVEVGGLVVDGSTRGLGVGRALMDAIERWAIQRGLAEVRLRSGTVRHNAHGFYEALGYRNEKSSYTFSKRVH